MESYNLYHHEKNSVYRYVNNIQQLQHSSSLTDVLSKGCLGSFFFINFFLFYFLLREISTNEQVITSHSFLLLMKYA